MSSDAIDLVLTFEWKEFVQTASIRHMKWIYFSHGKQLWTLKYEHERRRRLHSLEGVSVTYSVQSRSRNHVQISDHHSRDKTKTGLHEASRRQPNPPS